MTREFLKRLLLICAFCVFFSQHGHLSAAERFAAPQRNHQKKIELSAEKHLQILSKSARLKDGSFIFETEGKNETFLVSTRAGIFKPDTDYVLSFDISVEQAGTNSDFLHVFLRPENASGANFDLYRQNFQQSGEIFKAEARVRTPPSPKNYKLNFTAYGAIKGKLSNLTIFEGRGGNFFPACAGAEKCAEPPQKLPEGAPDFNIDLPRPQKEKTVNAADFGLDEQTESAATAINAAIAHCKKSGASKLVLPQGIYKCYENKAVDIADMSDFTFDGNGATLVFRKDADVCNMRIARTQRVRICNVNFDYDWQTQPLAAIVELVGYGVDSDKRPFADFKFTEYETYPYYGKNMRVCNLSPYDIKAGSVGVENAKTFGYGFGHTSDRSPEIKWLSPNEVRAYLPAEFLDFAGQCKYYRMQHYYYASNGVILEDNKHTTLQNINVHSCKGHAFVSVGTQQYYQFLNVNIAPPQRQRRPITCTADHLHVVNSRGYLKMIGCEFSMGADDCVNVHDCTYVAKRCDDRTLKVIGGAKNMITKGEILELRHGDFSPSGFIGAVSEIQKNGEDTLLKFSGTIPPQKAGCFVLFSKKYDSSNVLIKGCTFHSNRARGIILQCSNATIEDCIFQRNEAGALKILTGYTDSSWCEGCGVNNVVVRNCTFESPNPQGALYMGMECAIFQGVYMKTDPSDRQTLYPIISNILFENNRFKNPFGLVAIFASTSNLTFKDNIIESSIPRKSARDYRGGIYVASSKNVNILNNTWIESPLFPNPGITADEYSAPTLLAAGNRIANNK